MEKENYNIRVFASKVMVIIGLVLVTVLLFFLFYSIPTVLIIIFLAILLAVFLDGFAYFLHRYTKIPRNTALVISIIVLIGFIFLIGLIIGSPVVNQILKLGERLPIIIRDIKSYLIQFNWGRLIVSELPSTEDAMPTGEETINYLTVAFSTFLTFLGNILFLLFLGIYLAAKPDMYIDNAIKLLPKSKREIAREVLRRTGHALRYWLLGQFASMLVIGTLVGVGMWIVGVPLALSLGFIAGLFTFIPYLGPFIAYIPVALLTIAESPLLFLYASIVYIIVQQLEGYLITPMIHERIISLPPAVLITTQIIMFVLFGLAGMLIAAPLVVVIMVFIQIVYVDKILKDHVEILG